METSGPSVVRTREQVAEEGEVGAMLIIIIIILRMILSIKYYTTLR